VVDHRYANTAYEGQSVKSVVVHRYANTADKGTPVKIVVDQAYANTADEGTSVKIVHLVQEDTVFQNNTVNYVMRVFMESTSTNALSVRRSDKN